MILVGSWFPVYARERSAQHKIALNCCIVTCAGKPLGPTGIRETSFFLHSMFLVITWLALDDVQYTSSLAKSMWRGLPRGPVPPANYTNPLPTPSIVRIRFIPSPVKYPLGLHPIYRTIQVPLVSARYEV